MMTSRDPAKALRLTLVGACALASLAACGSRSDFNTLGWNAGGASGAATGPGNGAGRGGFGAGGRGGSATGGSGGAFPADFPDRGRTLESLTVKERRQLCLEDARRTDPCVAAGMQVRDEVGCNAALASCRASIEPAQVGAICDSVIDMSGCSVTVEQYFACLDTWNEAFVCANTGLYIPTPEPCQAVSACRLSNQGSQDFMQLGKAPPCDPGAPARPPDTNDDIYGADACDPMPRRMVALGDSIAVCDESSSGCAPLQLANYIRDHYSPSLVYEAHASRASDLVDLLREAQLVEGAPGHIIVWIFAFPSDPASKNFDLWQSQMAAVLDYFTAPSRFPDGATFLVNTQYSPSDQCPDPPPTFLSDPLTLEEERILQSINQRVFIDLAVGRDDTITVDQYPDWLGHGSNANVRGCPYCSSDNTPWVADAVHPNAAGQSHIFDKWRVAVDRMYGNPCTR